MSIRKTPEVGNLKCSTVVLGTLCVLGACAGRDPARFQQEVRVPAALEAAVSCGASGTTIAIEGELALAGLGATLVLRNNLKGTHEHEAQLDATMVLLPAGATVEIDAQTAGGEPVADPVVSVQFLGDGGEPVSDELVLGSCAGGTLAVDATAMLAGVVSLDVAAEGCSNHPGPTITVAGALTFSGLRQRLIVRDGAGGPIAGELVTDVAIEALEHDAMIAIPKQPSRGGVGGNPWMWLRLDDGAGEPLGEEILLGRCKQLAGEGDDEDEDEDDSED